MNSELTNMLNKTINGYTIKRPLGEGGMAEVWYAENGIGNPAAIKFLKKKFCEDESLMERFRNEAMVMVKLGHPYVRQVYDYATVDGIPCIIMEYLEGDDLKARLVKGERFSDDRLKKWWGQLADALNYTHQQGVIHRDIKPSNIFIDKYDNVKLMDFGIAKIEEAGGHTQTGVAMGTRIYMSPEQVRDPKRVKAATDSYSLAVTFVHLLTGKAPYDSTTSSDFDIQMAIVQEPLDLSTLSSEWRNFLQPYLAKKPEDRPELREFTTTTGSPNKEKPTSDDETIVESAAPPKPKVPKQPKKEQPQVSKEDKKSKNLMWIMGILLALDVVWAVLVIILHDVMTGFPLLNLFLWSTYTVLTVAFLLQFKQKKTKLIFGGTAVLLLLIQVVITWLSVRYHTIQPDSGWFWYFIPWYERDWLGYFWDISWIIPILFIAVGLEGLAFAKLYGRTKWVNASMAGILLLLIFGIMLKRVFFFSWRAPLYYSITLLLVCVMFFFLFRHLKKLESLNDEPLQEEEKLESNKRLLWIIGGAAVLVIAVSTGAMLKKPKVVVSELSNGDYEITVGDANFMMKNVEGGTFQMGATSEQESDAWVREYPVHSVTVSGFYMGETEVTQTLWKAVMGFNPSEIKGKDLPIKVVSWEDCQGFILKLNQLTGMIFRLPTEAEWEYAARGGNQSKGYKYAGSNHIGDVAWYGGNSGGKVHPVKTKSPNELGLYDMSGNVSEWCKDGPRGYSSSSQTNPQGSSSLDGYRVCRGGTYKEYDCCRVSCRDELSLDVNHHNTGFRLVIVRE